MYIMKLRIGLIGAGGFGTLHLSGYKKNENCELIAVASRTEKHAKSAARLWRKEFGGTGGWSYSSQSPRQYSNPLASASPGRLMSAEYPASFNACRNGRYS